MSHTHNHPEGLHCSCCNPMWKALLPNIELDEGKNNEDSEHSETLIFSTGSNPGDNDDNSVGYIQTMTIRKVVNSVNTHY